MRRQRISSGSPWEEMAGYSRAVAEGPFVFVSGTVGPDPATKAFAPGAREQAESALNIIERALREARAELADVVQVRAYVPERADVPEVAAVLKARLGAARPANTTVCCPLAVEGAKVEIEVTAMRRAAPQRP
jgi:enamine deaminase RidA (YjgF/YER057c/UK114 family)